MQSVINSVKGTALNVAEYLTPVLKVSYLLKILYSIFFFSIDSLSRNPNFVKPVSLLLKNLWWLVITLYIIAQHGSGLVEMKAKRSLIYLLKNSFWSPEMFHLLGDANK